MEFARYWVDGGVLQRNPSPVGVYWSIVLEGDPSGPRRYDDKHLRTNNEAEWCAVREALRHALARELRPVVIYSDSLLVVNQYNGRYAVRAARLLRLRVECRLLASRLPFVALQWRPREELVARLGH